MSKISNYLILISFSVSLAAQGQADVTIRKKDFRGEKKGFEEAWNHVQKGDSFYEQGGILYADAFESYIKAIAYNNSNPELNYKTGVSALFSDRKEEAAPFLMKALELKKDISDDAMFLTGKALQYGGQFQEAIGMFNSYLLADVKKTSERIAVTNKYLLECNSALLILKDTLNVDIVNMGPNINSASDEYAEVLTSDGKSLFFASRRNPDSKMNETSATDENIFVTTLNNGSWEQAVPAGKEITTGFSETPLFINKGADSLYIYSGMEEGGNILVSVLRKGKWKAPVNLPIPVNSLAAETSFCISADGNQVWFITDNKKDNMGGRDIFYIKRLKGHRWSRPVNAGKTVNSEYDEESVRLSVTGDTLWFSSKGHNSIGGFDIFYSIRNAAGEWEPAKNAGYPINTVWDEIFFNPSPVEKDAFYFVSNRNGGTGGFDIYSGRYLPAASEITLPGVPVINYNADTLINNDRF